MLKTVKTTAKELNCSKGKIKVMIRNKEISFELINGVYYVDIDEVRLTLKKENSNIIMTLDKTMKFIIKETLIDLRLSNVNTQSKDIRTLNNVYKNGYIKNKDELFILTEYYSNMLLDGYEMYPTEFVKWFDITDDTFFEFRKYYFHNEIKLSFFIEHFIMFNKLINNPTFFIVTPISMYLNQIKELHTKDVS